MVGIVSVMLKTQCLDCKHCQLYPFEFALSDVTPAEPAFWTCVKGRWSDGQLDDKSEVKFNLAKGQDCSQFEPEA